jgi:esterase/lipase superfamily enzyme
MVEIYFATNRNEKDGSFGEDFHADGPDAVRFGWAEVARQGAGDYKVQSIDIAAEAMHQSLDARVVREKSKLGSREVFERIRKRLQDGPCSLLVLIHGFANDFENALARVAEVAEDYSTPDRPVIGFAFSWPSNGKLFDYRDDRDDARHSGKAVSRTFFKLRDFLDELDPGEFCRGSLNVMAHSMGNWALQNAVDDIFNQAGGRPPRLFDHIFLMAADVDNDAFEHRHKLEPLPRLGKAVHLYFSADDRALMISDITKFNPDRLGAAGPRTLTGLDRKVKLVDCRHVDEPDRKVGGPDKGRDASVHQYYRLRQEVIEDIQHVLAGKDMEDIPGRRLLADNRTFQILPFAKRM